MFLPTKTNIFSGKLYWKSVSQPCIGIRPVNYLRYEYLLHLQHATNRITCFAFYILFGIVDQYACVLAINLHYFIISVFLHWPLLVLLVIYGSQEVSGMDYATGVLTS
jgi:hypothetical protein